MELIVGLFVVFVIAVYAWQILDQPSRHGRDAQARGRARRTNSLERAVRIDRR